MKIQLIIPLIISFILVLITLPKWIKKLRKIDLLWEDMNKFNHPRNVASSGGVVVIFGFVIGVLFYIAIKTFIFEGDGTNLGTFALLTVLLLLAVVGLVDDLLGWQHGGLSPKFRIFLAIIASIPLVVINAGNSIMSIPFFGEINMGLIYPLILIPLGIAGATTTYNFLAGFNGLEAGQGIIILSFLSFIAYVTGSPGLTIIGMCMVFSLIAFYFYNKFPAKVFPGDVLTYSIGALIAGMAILGNFEKIAVFIFIPYIIEIVLKGRGRLKKESFCIPQEDGSLEMPYEKIYGLTHLSLFILKKFKRKVYEKDVTNLIFTFQIIVCLVAFIIFREGILL